MICSDTIDSTSSSIPHGEIVISSIKPVFEVRHALSIGSLRHPPLSGSIVIKENT